MQIRFGLRRVEVVILPEVDLKWAVALDVSAGGLPYVLAELYALQAAERHGPSPRKLSPASFGVGLF